METVANNTLWHVHSFINGSFEAIPSPECVACTFTRGQTDPMNGVYAFSGRVEQSRESKGTSVSGRSCRRSARRTPVLPDVESIQGGQQAGIRNHLCNRSSPGSGSARNDNRWQAPAASALGCRRCRLAYQQVIVPDLGVFQFHAHADAVGHANREGNAMPFLMPTGTEIKTLACAEKLLHYSCWDIRR